jgi:hypothetical protein
VILGLVVRRSFGEGLHWGYGFSQVTKKKSRKTNLKGGFDVKSANFKDITISVKAVNSYHTPIRVNEVALTEIYPEPEVKKRLRGLLIQRKDREKLPCKWKVLGINVVNTGETVEIEVEPLRPLKNGYAYGIAVWRELSQAEVEAIIESPTQYDYNIGTPAFYLYKDGKLLEPHAREQPLPVRDEVAENRFCISCGKEISSMAKYCSMCGEKQESV